MNQTCCKKNCKRHRLKPWYLCEDCIKEIADKIAKKTIIEIAAAIPVETTTFPIKGGGGGGKSIDEQLADIKKKSEGLKRDWFSSKAR